MVIVDVALDTVVTVAAAVVSALIDILDTVLADVADAVVFVCCC